MGALRLSRVEVKWYPSALGIVEYPVGIITDHDNACWSQLIHRSYESALETITVRAIFRFLIREGNHAA